MRTRLQTWIAVPFALCVWLSASAGPSGAQGSATAGWTPPRMPDGRPDLQGVGANNDATPLERPAEFADKAALSDEELADLQRRVAAVLDGGDALFGDDLIRAALAPGTNFRGAGRNLHLTERFTRVDRDTIHYDITIEDPTTWTRPWTVRLRLQRTDDPIFEYACHEGNVGMEGILSGHRVEEAEAQVSR